jgi:hypothetical protein
VGEMRDCEEQLGQLVEKLKNEGIHLSTRTKKGNCMKGLRLGAFWRTVCPMVSRHLMIPSIVIVSIISSFLFMECSVG